MNSIQPLDRQSVTAAWHATRYGLDRHRTSMAPPPLETTTMSAHIVLTSHPNRHGGGPGSPAAVHWGAPTA
ncbi:MAG: hypothetical protein EOP36_12945, partial [Rubrivivax sp.]